MRYFKWSTLLALLGAFALAVTACGGSKDNSKAASGSTESTMGSTMEMGGSTAATVKSPGVNLRVTLDRLLAEHAELAMFTMQSGYSGGRDFKALAGALDANTQDLGKSIGSVYGAPAQKAFLKLWRAHIGFFVDYTVATAKKDEAGRKKALQKLAGYKQGFATFLSQATGLPASALAQSLQAHVNQLTAALDNYAAGRYDRAYASMREGFRHMSMTGDTLASGISEQKPGKFGLEPSTQQAADLRVTLDRLLSEHAILATWVMQKGFDGAPDFASAAKALDGNTVDLGAAIGSVYGPKAKRSFLKLWRAHIGFFVDYTVATAKGDHAGRKKALQELSGYKQGFAQFLSKATGLPASALAASLQMHVNQLTAALDDYAAGRYGRAEADKREAYAHMVMTGDVLAGAIVKQKPASFGG